MRGRSLKEEVGGDDPIEEFTTGATLYDEVNILGVLIPPRAYLETSSPKRYRSLTRNSRSFN